MQLGKKLEQKLIQFLEVAIYFRSSFPQRADIFYPSLQFSIFLYLSSVLSTLLILAVCRLRVPTNLVNKTYARHESPSSSVVKASDKCREGHGFNSRRGIIYETI